MNKTNYQKELEKIISDMQKGIDTKKTSTPKLLLHSCCAPCSSYCLEYLREYFEITVFYYNPNISAETEYQYRLAEEKRLIGEYNKQLDIYDSYVNGLITREELEKENIEIIENDCSMEEAVLVWKNSGMRVTHHTKKIEIIEGEYKPSDFYGCVKGYESCPEGGERCFICYRLRIRESFIIAKQIDADYVTSTLTISPLKNAEKINGIGYDLEKEFDEQLDKSVKWLPSDFKKKEGYKRSIELSSSFGLYRQNFCGCAFSKAEANDL